MKKSSFKPYSLGSSNRKTYQINQFLGVDYSTQKFQINNNRAIDILNYIYKDGVVQNRNGITQLLNIKPYRYTPVGEEETKINDTNINSMWQFIAEDKEKHIIAHIGKLLYEIKNIDNELEIEIKPIQVNGKCYEFENYSSQAFVGANKLWFLGGNKYMVLRFRNIDNQKVITLEPVEESDLVQIPTTTILITYADALVSKRTSLDKVNLLTKWRKNMLLSGIGKEETSITSTNFDYTLDSPMIFEKESDITDFSMEIQERGEL